jgi:signal transduction histidine kinase
MIIRAAVNHDGPNQDSPEFWGIVSGVIDLEYFFEKSGLNLAAKEMDISVRWNTESNGQTFFGAEKVFNNNSILLAIDFPNGQWLMAVSPKSGWPKYSHNVVVVNIWIFLIGVFVLINALSAIHFMDRNIKAEKNLFHALEAINEGFVLYDEKDRLELFNSKYAEIYAKSKDVLKIGTPFRDVIKYGVEHDQYPEAVGREEEFISERMKHHLTANSTVEQQVAGGKWIRIEERKTSDGGFVGIRMDITELKNAKDAAEKADTAKSAFLSIVGHELRTPLTVILGYTPLLAMLEDLPSFVKFKDALEQPSPDINELRLAANEVLQEVLGYTKKIDESGKHLLTVIDDIIALSKEAGEYNTTEIETRDVCDFIQELEANIRPAIADKGLKLSVKCEGGLVSTNFSFLAKILNSLIGNAIKFTDKGEVNITVFQQGDVLVFRVSDSGKGIPEFQLENIFGAFTQVDDSDVRKHGGVGLGLALVRKLVQNLGGTYGVSSIVDQGSTFWFNIPNPKID